jgi:uroporphyrinogen-III synthase
MRRVLALRPQPGASATVERASELGLDVVAIPLFEIEVVGWTAPDPGAFDGLLLTSANAVRHAGEELKRLATLPVYAVGETTAQSAREAGLHVATTGDGGVDQLLGSIAPGLNLLHLCGEDRREPQQGGQDIVSLPVYRARPIDGPDLSTAQGSIALVHSPRAGRRFAELVSDRAGIAVAAISPAAAESVGGGWEAVESASEPTDDALLALAARLCNKPLAK